MVCVVIGSNFSEAPTIGEDVRKNNTNVNKKDKATEITNSSPWAYFENFKITCDDYWRNLSSLGFREGLVSHQNEYLDFMRQLHLNDISEEMLLKLRAYNGPLELSTFEKWNRDFDATIDSWDYDSIQTYIKMLMPYPNFCMDDIGVVQKLFDQRHHIRLEEMEKIRQQHKKLSDRELLKKLLNDRSVILDFYPVELADYLLENGAKFLTEIERKVLKLLVTEAPYRKWRKIIDQGKLI